MSRPDALITFLPIGDLAATHRFYHDILGLPLVFDQGTCRIYRGADGGYVGFCHRDEVNPGRGLCITLVTNDVDDWHRRLEQHGVETDGAPRHNPTYGIYHFFTEDPDGWTVEVQRFDDPEWSKPL